MSSQLLAVGGAARGAAGAAAVAPAQLAAAAAAAVADAGCAANCSTAAAVASLARLLDTRGAAQAATVALAAGWQGHCRDRAAGAAWRSGADMSRASKAAGTRHTGVALSRDCARGAQSGTWRWLIWRLEALIQMCEAITRSAVNPVSAASDFASRKPVRCRRPAARSARFRAPETAA